MSLKEKIFKIFTLEDKKTEILITIISLLIQTISVMIIIFFNEIFNTVVFWILFSLCIFLFLIIIFQFLSIELTVENIKLTLEFTPEYDDPIDELFLILNIPSISVINSNICFETLDFSIQTNSNSLGINTSQRSENKVSRMYEDLRVFRERFKESVKISNDPRVKNLGTHCEIEFEIKGLKILKKDGAQTQSRTFDQGLTIFKTKDKITIILPKNCNPKTWKELKKMILE